MATKIASEQEITTPEGPSNSHGTRSMTAQRSGGVAVDGGEHHLGVAARRSIAALRVAIGFVFLWAFLDKAFGLGYSTPSARAWIHGGSPTKGFLASVDVGPFESLAHDIAGTWWADSLFMLGLLGVGVALMLGFALRIAAVSGGLILLMMWAAEWPLARFTSGGDPSGSVNPLVDYHIVYALALIVIVLTTDPLRTLAGRVWTAIPFVGHHSWLT
jgi:thiosulfate dehydrogenase [quinone] large subunit